MLSLLLENMLVNEKKCAIQGSLGVGKSTLLCLAMLYVVLIERKHVFMYRKLLETEQNDTMLYCVP